MILYRLSDEHRSGQWIGIKHWGGFGIVYPFLTAEDQPHKLV